MAKDEDGASIIEDAFTLTPREKKNIKKAIMKGVCVFDIDNTLTCGEMSCSSNQSQLMLDAIDHCIRKDFGVAINTARPSQPNLLWGIPTDVQYKLRGIDELKVFHRPNNHLSVPEQKHFNQLEIARQFRVKPEHVVLVDDRAENCQHVQRMGMPCVHIKAGKGITHPDLESLEKHLQFDS